MTVPRQATAIRDRHVRVHSTAEMRPRAERLREHLAARFPTAPMGRWHDRSVGPHTRAVYQVLLPVDLSVLKEEGA